MCVWQVWDALRPLCVCVCQVRRIVARRLVGDRVEYRVQWVGCGPEEDTWEPVTHLAQAQRALADFHRRVRRGERAHMHVHALHMHIACNL